jgi:hypothetical protein
MAHSVLTAPQLLTEEGAFVYVEARLWPNGPVCPHCGETGRIGRLKTARPLASASTSAIPARSHSPYEWGLFSRTATCHCICGCKLFICSVAARRASLLVKSNVCSIAA